MAAVTINVSEQIAERLNQLATRMDQSNSAMPEQAIEEFVARQEWSIEDIEAGLKQADANDFASDEDVARVMAKYLHPAG